MTTPYHEIPCGGFDDFAQKVRRLLDSGDKGDDQGKPDKWVFRGHRCANWQLETTLERACDRFRVCGDDRIKTEQSMIREFQRRLHHYTAYVPPDASVDELMALMRHHGAPTRLLDFTYSPYVAAYFAFENAECNNTIAIWAVNTDWCEYQLKHLFPELYFGPYLSYERNRTPGDFKVIFMDPPLRRFVVAVTPYRLNERLAYQRGAFLCPGDPTVGFGENLHASTGTEDLHNKVIKFTVYTGLNGRWRDQALRQLDDMNVNGITLFPDLDGFTKSFAPRTQFFRDMRW